MEASSTHTLIRLKWSGATWAQLLTSKSNYFQSEQTAAVVEALMVSHFTAYQVTGERIVCDLLNPSNSSTLCDERFIILGDLPDVKVKFSEFVTFPADIKRPTAWSECLWFLFARFRKEVGHVSVMCEGPKYIFLKSRVLLSLSLVLRFNLQVHNMFRCSSNCVRGNSNHPG